jgi:hypothetical protein
MKACLVALATLVIFDAVAWQSVMRHKIVGEALSAATAISALDWPWD